MLFLEPMAHRCVLDAAFFLSDGFKIEKKSLGDKFRMELSSRCLPTPLLSEALQKLTSLGKMGLQVVVGF